MNLNTIYTPFHLYFRSRRLEALARSLGTRQLGSVLDVGGSMLFHNVLASNGFHFLSYTIVNIHAPDEPLKSPRVTWVVSDALSLPFSNQQFDLIICNSLIEHLETYEAQHTVASEVRRVGQRYYVQTPNYWFPLEPHRLTVFLHWLPRRLLAKLVRWFTLWGVLTRPAEVQVHSFLKALRLLRRSEMAELFPDASHSVESCLGLAKSLIAMGPVKGR